MTAAAPTANATAAAADAAATSWPRVLSRIRCAMLKRERATKITVGQSAMPIVRIAKAPAARAAAPMIIDVAASPPVCVDRSRRSKHSIASPKKVMSLNAIAASAMTS